MYTSTIMRMMIIMILIGRGQRLYIVHAASNPFKLYITCSYVCRDSYVGMVLLSLHHKNQFLLLVYIGKPHKDVYQKKETWAVLAMTTGLKLDFIRRYSVIKAINLHDYIMLTTNE